MLGLAYRDIYEYVARKVGLTSDSPRLRVLVSDAVEQLMEESDGTLFRRVCCLYARNGAVALPHDILSVERAAYSGRRVPIIRQAAEFVEGIEGAHWHNWHEVTLHDRGFAPVWYDPPENPKSFVAVSNNSADGASTVTVIQRDGHGILTELELTVTVGSDPFIPSDCVENLTEIVSVVLPENRAGELTLSMLDTDGQAWILSKYDRHCKAAQFRRYAVYGLPNDNEYYMLYALVRLGFVEPLSEMEVCPIPSRSAIALMVQSVMLSERGITDKAEQARIQAINRLRSAALAARGGGLGTRIEGRGVIASRDYNL